MLLASNKCASSSRRTITLGRVPGSQGSGLPITGERTVPDVAEENYWFRRHEACYRWALDHLTGHFRGTLRPTVLDAGAGEGFGSAMAADRGYLVTAVELDGLAATHAQRRYRELGVVRANLVALPVRSDAFDACLSLQVIEHIWDVPSYLAELLRCTLGPVILSTPNRPVHSPGLAPGAKPSNVFHVREYDLTELDELLRPHLQATGRRAAHFGVRHGPAISEWEERNGSLPAALISGSVPEFADAVQQTDFVIEPFTRERAGEYLDLVSVL